MPVCSEGSDFRFDLIWLVVFSLRVALDNSVRYYCPGVLYYWSGVCAVPPPPSETGLASCLASCLVVGVLSRMAAGGGRVKVKVKCCAVADSGRCADALR